MPEEMPWPLLLQVFATCAMTGLIWFVQIVHYPLFDGVGPEVYPGYQERHMRLTTRVVGPLMLLEAATAVWMLVDRPTGVPAAAAWVGLGLLAVVWLATAFLAVPRHEALRRGFDARVHRGLVATNWVRTLAWTARAALVLSFVHEVSR